MKILYPTVRISRHLDQRGVGSILLRFVSDRVSTDGRILPLTAKTSSASAAPSAMYSSACSRKGINPLFPLLATFSLKLSPACAYSALILWGNAGRTPFVFVTLLLSTYPDELTLSALEFAVELRPAGRRSATFGPIPTFTA